MCHLSEMSARVCTKFQLSFSHPNNKEYENLEPEGWVGNGGGICILIKYLRGSHTYVSAGERGPFFTAILKYFRFNSDVDWLILSKLPDFDKYHFLHS